MATRHKSTTVKEMVPQRLMTTCQKLDRRVHASAMGAFMVPVNGTCVRFPCFSQPAWMTTLLLTDTAKLRQPNSGTAHDLPEPLDFVNFTEAVRGIGGMLESLAQ